MQNNVKQVIRETDTTKNRYLDRANDKVCPRGIWEK